VQGPVRVQGRPLFGKDRRLRSVPALDAALTEWRGENLNLGVDAPSDPAIRCLTTDDWKLVHYQGKDFGELYDRRNDPHEIRNLWYDPGMQPMVREMRERLLAFILQTEPLPRRTDIF